MHNAQDAVQKAHHVSELTSQAASSLSCVVSEVSQKESEIRDLKAEIAKKRLRSLSYTYHYIYDMSYDM